MMNAEKKSHTVDKILPSIAMLSRDNSVQVCMHEFLIASRESSDDRVYKVHMHLAYLSIPVN